MISSITLLLMVSGTVSVKGSRSPNAEAVDEYPKIVRRLNDVNRVSRDGISSCPCLKLDDNRTSQITERPADIGDPLESNVDWNSYGFGCAAHDLSTHICTSGCEGGENMIPPRIDCDRSWCERNWCWVDPNDCRLLHKRSTLFNSTNRFYSYATCWDMDSFTQNNRLTSLEGRVLRAGFNSNTGGWIGAYSDTAEHFKGPASLWSGPVVSFLTNAALTGHFTINLTEPPEFLRPYSLEAFGISMFDYCVYATSLGYLDLCIAQYTLTNRRALSTDWLVLGTQSLHMVVATELSDESSSWDRFWVSSATIFQPFTQGTWIFITFLVIPLLGCIMVVHEYGKPGSGYPRREAVVVERALDDPPGKSQWSSRSTRNQSNRDALVKERPVPFHRHIIRSIYVAFVAVLQQNYGGTLVTYGAMIHLLGVSFFIMAIIAVYTANLTAILTQSHDFVGISGFEEALSRGWRICSERRSMEMVLLLYPNITDDTFVADPPPALGGDGKPGFTCCGARRKVFEMLNPLKAGSDDNYCHAAIAPLEDLEVEHYRGNFCNMSVVGDVIGESQTGLPIFEGISAELTSLLLKLKNDGVFQKEKLAERPTSQCKADTPDEGEEGSALSLEQLSGIWVVSFGFAFIGLAVTFFTPLMERYRKERVETVVQYDQSGNVVSTQDLSETATIRKARKVEFEVADHRLEDEELHAESTTGSKGNEHKAASNENSTSSRWGALREKVL